MLYEDLTGQKFGRLTVVRRDGSFKGRRCWLCRCECGNIVKAITYNLKAGVVKSCGCLSVENRLSINKNKRLSPKEAAINLLYNQYKRSAAYKKYVFALDKQQFTSLILDKCHYCGANPTNLINPYYSKRYKRVRLNVTVCEEWIDKSFLEYNGIDRLDNEVGYIVQNCVTACSFCNYAKRERSYKEFITWLDDLVEFRKK